ncbi:MAG: hypothetical protein R3264_18210 [Anaerolineae bacterium]|nr:hypothetical protein [Anaerolineae bacterium]
MEVAIRIVTFLLGLWLAGWTLLSAVRTFVLPRADNVLLNRATFQLVFLIFRLRVKGSRDYYTLDRILALFPPIGLLFMPIVWIALVMLGYTGMFLSLEVNYPLYDPQAWYEAFWLSGSSLLTLGFAPVDNLAEMILAFSEATIGLGLVALLIAYLPTMHGAFTDREALVTMLEVRAGSPPSAVEMIARMHRIRGLEYLNDVWPRWEQWFVDIEQTHTSHSPLVFFRSPHPGQSWVVAAGTVLDAAALTASTLDIPREPLAELCIRSGYLTLRSVVNFFGIETNNNPHPRDPISIGRAEYDAVYDELAAIGVPVKADRDQAWRDFAGWRVNYDEPLRILAGMTQAPYAKWSGDRPIYNKWPKLFFKPVRTQDRIASQERTKKTSMRIKD